MEHSYDMNNSKLTINVHVKTPPSALATNAYFDLP